MPALFWAICSGIALLGAGAAVNILFGRDLARTRSNLLGVKRLSSGIRRLNEAALEKGRPTPAAVLPSPQPIPVSEEPRSAGRRRRVIFRPNE